MQFSRLRLVGFKSFVEPTDFEIRPGLTGIVGPNGCGKSNLVEALRWVMGETSYKSMRASGMDDVIFAGCGSRPPRNTAEVVLTLDNAARTAPAAFNDADVLEVTRRIERDSGSTYRVNGREVRARDVQVLFADASTGARSPALVRQNQVSEIISAKPQARRRILEEAAGVAGLHTRRHEAELRLKGAEENLARVADVLGQIAAQGDALRRQARQAQRFRELQAEIRRSQALAALLEWEAARDEAAAAAQALAEADAAVVERTRAQAEAARHGAVAAHAMPALREREAEASGALQNVLVARQMLEGEERRARNRRAETERRVGEMRADLARDTATVDDAGAALARLAAERADLAGRERGGAEEDAARAELAGLERDRSDAEAALASAQAASAEAQAMRRSLQQRQRDEGSRLARAERDHAEAVRARLALQADSDGGDALEAAARDVGSAASALAEAEAAAQEADRAVAAAREAEAASRAPLAEADRAAQRLETEARTLAKLVQTDPAARWAPVLDAVVVPAGLEAALGAALGDDLDAAVDPRAPAHWAGSDEGGDPALPDGATALATAVAAPPELHRRLAQVGLVERARGAALRTLLVPGQRLVSREGDLWRWDGFTRTANAPSAAARRLAERNRLAEVRAAAAEAGATLLSRKAEAEAAGARLRGAAAREVAARSATQAARSRLDGARAAEAAAVRRGSEAAAKLAALDSREMSAREARDEAARAVAATDAALAALPAPDDLPERLEAARGEAARLRAAETEARAALGALARERDTRTRRLAAAEAECTSWQTRAAQAKAHRDELAARLARACRELEELAEAPDRFVLRRRQIQHDAEAAESALSLARDERAAGELALAEADRRARAALDAMAAARETKARDEARVGAARQRVDAVTRAVAADLERAPAGLPELAGVEPGGSRPPAVQVAARLDMLRGDRERLGAVNLRADDELAALEAQRSGLDKEKGDLAEAIGRLRQAIGTLNREGRERLLEAFGKVDEHFKALFTELFGGGNAELQLVESEDPLEAGLEILARPPGKRPQVMTLLSGGEQALTAISLIFAVFLSNPAPICVLDEVDAPLDDANVERFCDLVDAMRRRTRTRFIAITHNPITMARMDRLYGVTQAERGISQLVGVELTEAEQLLAAS